MAKGHDKEVLIILMPQVINETSESTMGMLVLRV